jgi:hypothetical protein
MKRTPAPLCAGLPTKLNIKRRRAGSLDWPRQWRVPWMTNWRKVWGRPAASVPPESRTVNGGTGVPALCQRHRGPRGMLPEPHLARAKHGFGTCALPPPIQGIAEDTETAARDFASVGGVASANFTGCHDATLATGSPLRRVPQGAGEARGRSVSSRGLRCHVTPNPENTFRWLRAEI